MEDFYRFENNQLTLIPPFENKEPEHDDWGVRAHPIYSNHSKDMSDRRTGGAEIGGPQRTSTNTVQQETKPSA